MLESEGQFEPMPIIFIENCNIQEASSPVAAMLPFISIQAVIYVKDKKIGKGVRRRSFFIILAGKRPESLWSLQMVKSLWRTFTSTCSRIKVLMEGLEDEINIFWEKMNLLWYLGCQAINPNPISTHQAWLVCTVFVNQTSYFPGKISNIASVRQRGRAWNKQMYEVLVERELTLGEKVDPIWEFKRILKMGHLSFMSSASL